MKASSQRDARKEMREAVKELPVTPAPPVRCWKCHREAQGVEVSISGNRSRIDCEYCGYFLRWGRWWENPNHD